MNNLKDLIAAEDRPTAKELLVSARRKLNPHAGEFVCCNLSESAQTWEEKRIVGILRAEISHRIEGRATVCGWLREVAGVETLVGDGGNSLVEYRQRWIDSMIAELS